MRLLRQRLDVLPLIIATFLGAFLAFQVQPVISKTVLPWFGGSPAVWTTCMLFFQVLLFGGYLYAHLLTMHVPRRFQGFVHASLLGLAALSLPIQPQSQWEPTGSWPPVLYLLAMLAAHVGLPYFVLTSTGPLVQAWLARRRCSDEAGPSRSAIYRLYAFSNIGSLSALVSYPFLFEPRLAVDSQSTVWSLLFCLFAILQGILAIWLSSSQLSSAGDEPAPVAKAFVWRVSRRRRAGWLLLPALASVMLLAVTNHVCQDIAVIPFLWVLPLSLYLLSFIICFDRAAWYRPRLFACATLLLVLATILVEVTPLHDWMLLDATLHLSLLLAVCMVCHGEVARLKPHPSRLTEYYLMLSGGGALGGLAVALLCPLLFTNYTELPIAAGLATALAAALVIGYAVPRWATGLLAMPGRFDVRRVRRCRPALAGLALLTAWLLADSGPANVLASNRSFFGVLRIVDLGDCKGMMHGRTLHGLQLPGQNARQATVYYSPDSGVGRVLAAVGERGPLRLGGVGLGCGVLATYGRAGDHCDFIEINPHVIELAKQHFSFLDQSAAEIECIAGDGRLVLERQQNEPYDVLVLDAFSSDSVPAHLLTREAMQLYQRRLKPDGVLVVHVTNRHLRLPPVVHRLADDAGWKSVLLTATQNIQAHSLASQWIVIAAEQNPIWQSETLRNAPPPNPETWQTAPLWTDQYHNLLSVVRIRSRT